MPSSQHSSALGLPISRYFESAQKERAVFLQRLQLKTQELLFAKLEDQIAKSSQEAGNYLNTQVSTAKREYEKETQVQDLVKRDLKIDVSELDEEMASDLRCSLLSSIFPDDILYTMAAKDASAALRSIVTDPIRIFDFLSCEEQDACWSLLSNSEEHARLMSTTTLARECLEAYKAHKANSSASAVPALPQGDESSHELPPNTRCDLVYDDVVKADQHYADYLKREAARMDRLSWKDQQREHFVEFVELWDGQAERKEASKL